MVFVGEAPGVSENALGIPFIGPAGHLLDQIIDSALKGKWTYAITNLVGCIPLGEDGDKAIIPPDDESLLQCKPRLEEFIAMCRPKLIVAVGKLSKEWLEQGYRTSVAVPVGTPIISINHPAYIIRQSIVQQGFLKQQCIVSIASALRKLDALKQQAVKEQTKTPEPEVDWGTDEIPF